MNRHSASSGRLFALLVLLRANPTLGDGLPSRFYDAVKYHVAFANYSQPYASVQYASVEDSGDVNVNRTGAFRNETFELTDLDGGVLMSGDRITLRSWQGWYASARHDMQNLVYAGPQWGLGDWERFRIYKIVGDYVVITGVPIFPGDRIGIMSNTGQWLSARYDRPNHRLTCDQSHCWAWETFIYMSKGYSTAGAANYMLYFALSYNPQFVAHDQDCTNGASQALLAGGWQKDGQWYPESTVWVQANLLNNYIAASGRAVGRNSQLDLQVGDVITADWRKYNTSWLKGHDGIIDHVMVVTEKLADGRVRVSYHSNDRQNKLFDEVLAVEPTSYAVYTYWHFNQ